MGIPSLNVSLFCVKTVNHTNKNRNQIIYKQIADFSWSNGRHVFVAESFPHHVQLISNDPPVASQEPGGSRSHVLTSAYETDTVASCGKANETNASAHAARNAERSSKKRKDNKRRESDNDIKKKKDNYKILQVDHT